MKSQALKYAQGLIRSCFIYTGVECFSLSSSPPSSEEGHITACPHTTVTLTCAATQVGSLLWRDQNGLIDIFLSDEEPSVVQEGPYTLTLVLVENLSMSGLQADLVSTLEVMVDDIDNGTDIECAVFMRMDSRLIYITSEYTFMPQTSSCIIISSYIPYGSFCACLHHGSEGKGSWD